MRESFLGHQKDGAGITMTWNPDYKPSLRSSWHCLPFSSLFLDISAFLSASLCLLFSVSWHFFSVLGDLSKGPCTEFLLRGNHRESFFGFSKVYHFFFPKVLRKLDITNHIVLFSTRLFSPLLFSALPFSTCLTLLYSVFFHLSFFVCSTPPHPSWVCSSLLPFSTLLFSILLYFSLLHSTLPDATRLYSALLYSTQPDSIPFFVLLFLHALNKEGSPLNFFWC